MGIGASIFLMALGGILAFALTDPTVGGVNLDVVGVVLMLAGLVGLAITLYLARTPRTTTVVDETVVRDRPHDIY